MNQVIITPEQCRGARAMLDWSRARLAAEAKVSQATLADFENGKPRTLHERTLVDIRRTLEAGGIELTENGVILAPIIIPPLTEVGRLSAEIVDDEIQIAALVQGPVDRAKMEEITRRASKRDRNEARLNVAKARAAID